VATRVSGQLPEELPFASRCRSPFVSLHSCGLLFVSLSVSAVGPWGSVHPRHKQLPGARLAYGALAQVYGQAVPYVGPTAAAATGSSVGTALSVSVSFLASTVAGGGLAFQPSHCPTELGVPVAQCAWFSIAGSDGKLYNATAAITGGGTTLDLSAIAAAAGVTPVAASYGYGTWPIAVLYATNGLPATPFNVSVSV